MTSSIQFGTLRTDGATARLFGTSSGIDTDRLIDALVQAKRLPAVRLESRIARNEAKVAALRELSGLLARIRDAVAGLRNPPGVFGVKENVFEAKDVFLSANTATAPNALLAASAAPEAEPSAYSLVIERLATAHKLASDSVASGTVTLADAFNGGVDFRGQFALGLAGGASATVTVDGAMDIYDLEAAIDAVSTTTGVEASVLKVADDDFRLLLAAKETGKAIQFTAISGTNVPDLVGLTTGGAASRKHELQAAQTAKLAIDGVTVERSSNLVDDVIRGVKLNLFKADPSTTVTVEVQRSASRVKDAITELVDAVNAFRDFVERHRQVSENGEVPENAVLFGNATLRSAAATLGDELARSVAGLPAGSLAHLADIGVTLDSANRLVVDEAALEDALLTRFDDVRRLFEFSFAASSADLRVYGRTNALADTSFTVDIVDADGDGAIESATIDGVAADVRGGRIVGRAGTAYEGLELLWVGRGSTSITVNATQGIGDRLYNALRAMFDEQRGALPREIAQLTADNDRYEVDIEKIDERVERFRQSLIDKFAALERTLSMLNVLLGQVRAQIEAFSGKSD